MSAIVAEPVASGDGATVLDSMRSRSSSSSAEGDSTDVGRGDPAVMAGRRGRPRSGRCDRARGWCAALLGQVREEEGLVDPTLEDRHAQLHALLDDLAPFHAGLARELRGREVDCHRYVPPVRFATDAGRYRLSRMGSTEVPQREINTPLTRR